VRIIALDRTTQVRAFVGDGSRWGLNVEVIPHVGHMDSQEINALRSGQHSINDNPPPDDVVLLDHLPGFSRFRLFESYQSWFESLCAWIPNACTTDRIGRREIESGVTVGLHSRISSSAELIGPCWIGDNVFIGPDAVIGPGVILEDRAYVEAGARIERSVIGIETFVGELTLIEQSIACGSTLINWKTRSCLDVPDAFLLCSLGVQHAPPRTMSWVKTPFMSLRDLIPRQQE
jgi:acetyltransferase-like isoleucine patch superfamily enzyme